MVPAEPKPRATDTHSRTTHDDTAYSIDTAATIASEIPATDHRPNSVCGLPSESWRLPLCGPRLDGRDLFVLGGSKPAELRRRRRL